MHFYAFRGKKRHLFALLFLDMRPHFRPRRTMFNSGIAETGNFCHNTGVSSAGMQQGMKQSMVATAAMQMFMRALQATNMELQQIAAQAMAANPALEEQPPAEHDAESTGRPDAGATLRHEFFLESLTEEETLTAHLTEQIRQSALPAAEEEAALCLIRHLDEHGYFDATPERIAAEENMPAKVFRAALRAVRDLDPAGVGAADLRDSLMLQLERLDETAGLPMLLLRAYWEDLVRHRYAEAAKMLGCTESEVAAAARRIARLNPDPGSGFAREERHVIAPDLVVESDLSVRLTGENVPRLTLSAAYREMMAEKADKPEVRAYLSRCFREGRELIRAVEERQQTILTIARALVSRQKEFFRKGPHALAPLKMEDIAADCACSISTVSRAVNGKYLRCSHGVYELRSFFTAALPAENGNEGISAGAVQARIRALIDAEDPRKPLSDAKIEAALAAEGTAVARRTIAKYREQMKILPASLRKLK